MDCKKSLITYVLMFLAISVFSQGYINKKLADNVKYSTGRVNGFNGKLDDEIYVGQANILASEFYGYCVVSKNDIFEDGEIDISKMAIALAISEFSGDDITIEMGIFLKNQFDPFSSTEMSSDAIRYFKNNSSNKCNKVIYSSNSTCIIELTEKMRIQVSDAFNNGADWVGFYFRKIWKSNYDYSKVEFHGYKNLVRFVLDYEYCFRDINENDNLIDFVKNGSPWASFNSGQGNSLSNTYSLCENDIDWFKILINNSAYYIKISGKNKGPYQLYMQFNLADKLTIQTSDATKTSERYYNTDTKIEFYSSSNLSTPIITDDDSGDENYSQLSYTLPYLTIELPNSSTTWIRGENANITWIDNISENVKIELYKGSTNLGAIEESTPSDGGYTWKVESSSSILPNGSNYRIKITSNSNSGIYDFSDYFSISGNPDPSINIDNPNSSTTWIRGENANITWIDNISENVKIEIYNGSTNLGAIEESTPSDGGYTWQVNSSSTILPNGSNYRIKITSNSNSDLYDFSDYFSITGNPDPSININNPNSSTTWTRGVNANITWTDNISENVKIELYKGNTNLGAIEESTPSDGTNTWNVNSSSSILPDGNDYRVKISSVSNSSIYDYSDYFKINGTPDPYISINSPKLNYSWIKGGAYDIVWNDNINENVEIILVKGNENILVISQSTESDGNYSWTIPINLATESNYKIRISSVSNSTVSDISDTFTIKDSNPTVGENGTFIDGRDNKIYKWIKIGEQFWLAENLAYLPSVNEPTSVSQTESKFYVYGYNGNDVNIAKSTANFRDHGVLYNWSATQNACPLGWQLPNDSDWEKLATFISQDIGNYNNSYGDWDNVGMHLKKQNGWDNDGNGTNEYGFSATPGGYLDNIGYFNLIGKRAFFWSGTRQTPDQFWDLYSSNPNLYSDHSYGTGHGYSIRCVRNTHPNTKELSVSNENISTNSLAGTYTFKINSNTTWNINENIDWLSCNINSGSNYATIIISFSQNDSESERNSQFSISAQGVDTSIVINVTQGGKGDFSVEPIFEDKRDNQEYKYVVIGNQTWMAENLNYWTSSSHWYNNSSSDGDIYGRLYTYNEAQNICPESWHLPSDSEWKELEMFLGMSKEDADTWGQSRPSGNVGIKLKSISGWNNNGNGDNSSGFNALASGYRESSGSFVYKYQMTGFWATGDYALKRRLYNTSNYPSRGGYTSGIEYCVRCLKDESYALSVSETELQLESHANSTKSFQIISNSNWLIETDDSWLITSSQYGNGNAVIQISSASANESTTTNREGSIIIKGAGLEKTISIKQKFTEDIAMPYLITYSPHNETILDNHPTFSLSFNEDIIVGNGYLNVYESGHSSPSVSISTNGASINGKDVLLTYDATKDGSLNKNTDYYVTIDEGAFKDVANNNSVGISGNNNWYFRTGKDFAINVKNIDEKEFEIYPNPTKTILNILIKDQLYSDTRIKLVNMNGQIVINRNIDSLKTKIDLRGNTPGIYVLHIISKHKTFTKKIILK